MTQRFDTGVMGLFARLRQAYPETDPALREAQAEAALATRRGQAQWQAPPTAARHASPLLKPFLKNAGAGLSELKRRWPEIVGDSLGQATAPEKLAAGVLTVRAPSAIAPFIQHQASLILNRCALMGAKASKLAIAHGAPVKASARSDRRQALRPLSPEEEADLAATLTLLPEGRLKQAVARLGRAMRRS